MKIKSRYLISQIKIFDEIFVEIKSSFQRKILRNQGNLL